MLPTSAASMTTNVQALESYSLSTFALQSIPDFPFVEYTYRQREYANYIRWYNGEKLRERMTIAGKPVEKYPLKINPFEGIVLKHVAAMFGETKDDTLPLVSAKFVMDSSQQGDEGLKERAQKALDLVNRVWWESNGRSLQLENGFTSEIFGGCVFGIRYVPWEWDKYGGFRQIPFRIERADPMYWYGIPIPGDNVRMAEVWYVQPIDWRQARLLGYNAAYNEPCWWIEHYDQKGYSVRVNMEIPQLPYGAPADGENAWGRIVPWVYIPHVREGGFWGRSEIPGLQGEVTEYNLRFADYGDAVSIDSHVYAVMKNVQGTPTIIRIGTMEVINLNSAPNITGAEKDAELEEIHKPLASAAMKDLLNQIWTQICRDSKLPAVAYGEDEGSQRSGQTLLVRMWPLFSHTAQCRVFWDSGLNWLTQMLLRMMQKMGIPGVDDEICSLRVKQVWAPEMAKDREQVVTEATNRMVNDMASLDTILDLFGDVEDKEREKQLIQEFMKFKAETEAAARPQPTGATAPGGTASKGAENSSGAKNKKPKSGG